MAPSYTGRTRRPTEQEARLRGIGGDHGTVGEQGRIEGEQSERQKARAGAKELASRQEDEDHQHKRN